MRYDMNQLASLEPVLTILFQIFCPMSMTDGTARVIELSGSPKMKEDLLPRLISRDPAYAFTSGQWMTEVLPHTKNMLTRSDIPLIATWWLRRLIDRNNRDSCGRFQPLRPSVHSQRFQMVLQCN